MSARYSDWTTSTTNLASVCRLQEHVYARYSDCTTSTAFVCLAARQALVPSLPPRPRTANPQPKPKPKPRPRPKSRRRIVHPKVPALHGLRALYLTQQTTLLDKLRTLEHNEQALMAYVSPDNYGRVARLLIHCGCHFMASFTLLYWHGAPLSRRVLRIYRYHFSSEIVPNDGVSQPKIVGNIGEKKIARFSFYT